MKDKNQDIIRRLVLDRPLECHLRRLSNTLNTPDLLVLAADATVYGLRWSLYFASASGTCYLVQECGPRTMFTAGFLRDITFGFWDLCLFCLKLAAFSSLCVSAIVCGMFF